MAFSEGDPEIVSHRRENLSVSCLTVKLLLFTKTDTFFYQLTLHLLDANPIMVEILFFLVSRNQNLGEMYMRFELQVGSPWINLAEIWSNCCQIAHLQNRVCEF